jgi:PhnB protein
MKRTPERSGRVTNPVTLAQQLDKAVHQIISDRKSNPSRVNSRIAGLVRIASDLRDLPAENFRARLKKDLVASIMPAGLPGAEPQASEVAPHQRPGSIMPFMYQDDVVRAFEVYQRVFGATEIHRITRPDGKVSHIAMAIGPTHVMLRDVTTPDLAEYRAKGFANTPRKLGGSPLHLYIYVADANAAFKRALDSGSTIVDPMGDKEWGDRCGGVQDPFGHIWYIATPLKSASH